MKCSQCGWDVASVWRFCPWCGTRLLDSAGTTLSMPAISDTPVPVAATQLETGVPQPAIDLDGEATDLGRPALEVLGDTDATGIGSPAVALDPDATSIGSPAVALDSDATSLGAPAVTFDPDATSLGAPAVTFDPDATGLSQPIPFDSDSTMLGAAPVGATPEHGPSRPPTGATPVTPFRRPPTGTAKVTRPATSRTKRPSSAGIGSGAGTLGGSIGATGPLEIGEAFGPRYHIIRMLGIGGMGAVYQAWDSELEVALALKVIRPDATSDPEAAAEIERRFKRELLLARQVTHPNVVRIHDLGEIDGIKYITMPYIEGKDLSDILAETTTLPVPRTLAIAKQVASGLVAAHEAGVVHRDLKPANIMIDAEDKALIMDFGIARAAGGATDAAHGGTGALPTAAGDAGATRVGTIVGTLDYMAPEQARGVPVDQRADVYAFGLILYRMLVGKRLADGATNAFEDLKARMQAEPQKLREIDETIPEHVEALISKCLQPEADARFQTTAELLHALERLDENGIPLPEPPPIWKSRRFWAAAASIMTILVAGTWWLAQFIAVPVEVKHDPVSVLIADFTNGTGDPTFDSTLGQTVRRALEDASFISAYDRSRVGVLGVRPPEKLDDVAARELAVKQGLGVVLAGSVQPKGAGYEISMKAAQTVTGEEITSVKAVASDKNRVLETATKLVARVRKALGDQTSESAQLFAMRTLSTSSLEVVSQYAAGMEAQSRGKYEEARKFLTQAVELDPKFGLGYQGLAITSRNLDRPEDADKYIKEALRYVDGMTERERFSTRGFYYRMIGDNQQCAKEYGELITRYAADPIARNQRAICLAKLRNMREAVEELRQAVRVLPNQVGFRGNLALFMNLGGQFEEAEQEIKTIQQPDARAVLALAYSQLGRGMLPEATETYQKLGTMGAAGASSASSGLGDLAVYEGRFSDALKILQEGAAADLASNNPLKAAIKFTTMGNVHLNARRKAAAVAAADKALTHSTSMPVRFLAARIFAEAGALDKARALATSLSSELPAEPRAHGKIIEGLIALRGGNARDAVGILTEANGILDTWFGHYDLGRAYMEAGAFLEADSEFDRCMVRRGEALSLMDEGPTYGHFPPVYYYQGRVRQELNTAAFADAYRGYLKIRGQSKEDPLVPEVRKRVGELTSSTP